MTLIKETDYGTPKVTSEKMVTLEIDGQEITVPEGTSIMRAAMEMGTGVARAQLDREFISLDRFSRLVDLLESETETEVSLRIFWL